MDDEPIIGLGGANYNADPIGKRELLYPIAVILDSIQLIQYKNLKQKLGLTDLEIFAKFHPCFLCDNFNETSKF